MTASKPNTKKPGHPGGRAYSKKSSPEKLEQLECELRELLDLELNPAVRLQVTQTLAKLALDLEAVRPREAKSGDPIEAIRLKAIG